jgi:hypothetical protein
MRHMRTLFIALTLAVAPLAFASTEISNYDRHVIFDNSLGPDAYPESNSYVVAPSRVEMADGKFPVEVGHFKSPPNALRLHWRSAPGGDWRMTVEIPRRYARPFSFTGDTLSFWLYSDYNITAETSPRVYLKDIRDNGTPSVTLVPGKGALAAGQWLQIRIPLASLHSGIYRDTDDPKFVEADLVSVSFVQGLDDNTEHTLYLDDFQIIPGSAASGTPPPSPAKVEVKAYERHFDVSWTGSADPQLLSYRIYRSEDGGPWKAVGTQQGTRTRYLDFVGPPPHHASYRVAAVDILGQESEPSAPSTEATTHMLDDDGLMSMAEEACFHYYWDAAHPNAGLAPEVLPGDPNLLATGGNGFGVMALIVGAERGFEPRDAIAARVLKIVRFLAKADRFHGVWPHFIDGRTGHVIPFFGRYDNGGDLVETAFMLEGLLTARHYFNRDNPAESEIRSTITRLWREVDFTWYRSNPESPVLYWHWSPDSAFHIHHPLVGWNEAMIVYILAISSPTHPVPASMYYSGWAGTSDMQVEYRRGWSRTKLGDHYANGNTFYGTKLAVGEGQGSDLFFVHFSYMGFDPHALTDRFTNYFENNRAIARINYAYCVENPLKFVGYGKDCWGISAGVNAGGGKPYPRDDNGTISCMAALASMPYTPEESLAALRHFYRDLGPQIFGCYGFHDGFNQTEHWFDEVYMALDQAPITVMIENHRTGLIWKNFMANPEIPKAINAIANLPLTSQ